MVAKGEGTQGGIDWKVGVSRCKLLYMHIMDKCKKKYICICVYVCLCVCVCVCVCVSHSVMSDSATPWTVACQAPGSFVHRFLQARILEWVAIPFSRGSS